LHIQSLYEIYLLLGKTQQDLKEALRQKNAALYSFRAFMQEEMTRLRQKRLSDEDKEFTTKCIAAANALHLQLLDHLILSRNGFTSLKDEMKWEN
jgi:DNA repair protein RadC